MNIIAKTAAGALATGLCLAAPALSGPVQAAGLGLGQHAFLADGGNNNNNGNHNNNNNNDGNRNNGGSGNNSGVGSSGQDNGHGNTVPETPYAVIFPAAMGAMAWVVYRKKSRPAS